MAEVEIQGRRKETRKIESGNRISGTTALTPSSLESLIGWKTWFTGRYWSLPQFENSPTPPPTLTKGKLHLSSFITPQATQTPPGSEALLVHRRGQ